MREDSDLGAIEVTVDVPALTPAQAQAALAAGRAKALNLQRTGHIVSCVITCQGWAASTEGVPGRFLTLDPMAKEPAQRQLLETA